MRRRTAMLAVGAGFVSLATAVIAMPTLLIWNVTQSVPTGLYLVSSNPSPRLGQRVVLEPDAALRDFLARRGYLPVGVPLVKEIAALPGSRVCRHGLAISIDGRLEGYASAADNAGRPLPVWQGCRRLSAREIFLMNRASPASFDGRYFGPVPAAAVMGRAIPVWTDERGDGHRTWFAAGLRTAAGLSRQGE